MVKEDTLVGAKWKLVVENLNKSLYKLVLYSIKMVPMLIAGIYLLNTVLSYYWIELPFLSYVIMFLLILELYFLSFTFKFCRWHRMFIHYILLNLILNTIDYYCGIPISNKGLFLLYLIITGMFLFFILWLKFKACKK